MALEARSTGKETELEGAQDLQSLSGEETKGSKVKQGVQAGTALKHRQAGLHLAEPAASMFHVTVTLSANALGPSPEIHLSLNSLPYCTSRKQCKVRSWRGEQNRRCFSRWETSTPLPGASPDRHVSKHGHHSALLR